jgi:hypothetical protein
MEEVYNQNDETTENVESKSQNEIGDLVEADVVEISMGGANKVQAKEVIFRQAGANHVVADQVQVRQGGIAKLDANTLEITSGGVGYASVQDALFNNSSSGAVIAKGAVRMDLSGAQVMVAGKGVEMDQSGAVLMVSPRVTMENGSNTVFLFSAKVNGEINTVFGPKESVLFGIVAGIAASLVFMISSLFRKKRKKD